ncbi:MAG: Phenylalanine--tRNA ligase beta subunit [Flavobacteriales bacterium]|nr:Phenylalanine--tRNA ligase beta subunit [Flavobacteriales bacterium]
MKISYSWLKNYIKTDIKPEEVAQLLTDTGLEVEGFEKIQTVKGGLEGLVIGEVLTKTKHPDADRLNVTTVNVGGQDPLQIVCGAANVAVGQKVVVATVGTILYNGEESFQIKKSKIRGEVSEGMICAEDEIGLGNSHDGIMVLNADAKIGSLAKEYFKIEDDFVFEIGLTPNRTDATSHIGVARDLAAALNLKNPTTIVRQSVDAFKVDNTNLTIAVDVLDAERCPRYTGITLSGIEVKDSPDWLKNKLLAIGLKPINNIVDVTNFVLHETGQPLHAFDADKIAGKKVIVKTVADQTVFTTLDDKERKLSANDLMICNNNEPMCIAGVFGGAKSGVNNSTKNIFLESAYFNPVSVRKTAKFHGLNTDASFRYERGADPNITVYALKRAILLMQEVAGGKVSSEIIDVYPKPIQDFNVELAYSTCDKLIGEKLDRAIIKKILLSLEIKIVNETAEGLMLQIPPFKADVQRDVDVVEEVLRVFGYNNIKLPDLMSSALVYRPSVDKDKIINTLSDLLVSQGFNEILSNSLTKSSYYQEKDSLVKLLNPLSSELDVMRQTLLFNGLETIVYNQNRKSPNIKFFEIGKTYTKQSDKFVENSFVGIFISGNYAQENWNVNKAATNFFHLKGYVQTILEKFGLAEANFLFNQESDSLFNYALNYQLNDKELVKLGKVSTKIQKQFDITNEVFYAQINLDNFIKLASKTKIQYKEISKYPSVRRDLALLIDKQINYHQLEQLAYKQEKRLLKQVNLFDVYEGKNLEEGKKSYAVSFVFQDDEKTLTDVQIDKTMERLIQVFNTELGAKLR